MPTTLPSDEVANDYKSSLEDLVTNDRFQISNLTLIAKESIEHAEAISRVLQNHISRTPPQRKLPALYVLDSIVKNVGTPFTVYFGRNLRDIFLLAYSQVDTSVRRKLEEMLKTWREPVPGSLSTSPVFPIQSTQPIVDALNRYRANTPQPRLQQPVSLPNRIVQSHPFRSMPTPPQQQPFPLGNQTQSQPPQQYATPQYQQSGTYYQYSSPVQMQHQIPPRFTPQQPIPTPVTHSSYPPYAGPPSLLTTSTPPSQFAQYLTAPTSSGLVDVAKLHADIDDLTIDAKIDCASHPLDSGAQNKLATLQGLKEMLDGGNLSNEDLVDVRNTVMQQMAKKLAPHRPTPPLRSPFSATAAQHSFGTSQPMFPAPAPSVTPSFLNQNNLTELLRAMQGAKPSLDKQTNLLQNNGPGFRTPAIVPVSAPPPAAELQVLAQLRASGFFSNTSMPLNHAGTRPFTPPQGLSSKLTGDSIELKFTSSSIKLPRPQMLTSFLNARPNQCATCGRRFTSDDTGREKKARHLDWHFRTKTRMAEAERRGQNRSWYVDEREWIASRENEDDAGVTDTNGTIVDGLSPSAAATRKMIDYVRAPTDPALRSAPCPIDQEVFRSEWSEELQDFIWKDAIKVGNRYYHATCFQEATKDRDKDVFGSNLLGTNTARTSTPDSVLGKRKAEQAEATSLKSRVKMEAA